MLGEDRGNILKESSKDDDKETYKKWKSLVNMTPSELKKFIDSEDGKNAGLSRSEASKQGISNGRDSARAIIRMKDKGVDNWTSADWKWAKKQISFISRMKGGQGSMYEKDGKTKTRKHTSLLIWGHNPRKK